MAVVVSACDNIMETVVEEILYSYPRQLTQLIDVKVTKSVLDDLKQSRYSMHQLLWSRL
jgi:hypothetical protein